jgi:hypothetical protein
VYPMFENLDWDPEAVWTFWRRGSLLSSSEIEPRFVGFAVRSPVTLPTTLTRLLCIIKPTKSLAPKMDICVYKERISV